MNSETGKTISGIEHLKQSIVDILTTPIGARVMRRDYGSRLFELIDHPIVPGFAQELYAAVAEACPGKGPSAVWRSDRSRPRQLALRHLDLCFA